MATCKVSIKLVDALINDNKIGEFNFDIEVVYSQEELLAVINALPEYMKQVLQLIQGEES